MTKQPELPEFFRDLEIVQSLNRIAGQAGDADTVPQSADLNDLSEPPTA